MTTYKIAVLPGDGIGAEVTSEAVKVLKIVAKKIGSHSHPLLKTGHGVVPMFQIAINNAETMPGHRTIFYAQSPPENIDSHVEPFLLEKNGSQKSDGARFWNPLFLNLFVEFPE